MTTIEVFVFTFIFGYGMARGVLYLRDIANRKSDEKDIWQSGYRAGVRDAAVADAQFKKMGDGTLLTDYTKDGATVTMGRNEQDMRSK